MADNRNKKKNSSNYLKQGSILAVAAIFVRVIGMLYRIPVTRIIGNEGNSFYSSAFDIYTIMLLVSSYSIPLAVAKQVSARNARGEYRNAQRVFHGAMVFALVTGIATSVITFFGAGFFTDKVLHTPESAFALRILAPALLILAIMGVFRGYFQGQETMVPTAVSQLAEQVVNAIVSIGAAMIFVKMGANVDKILGTTTASAAYGAGGSTLGTTMGALAGLLFLVFVYVTGRRRTARRVKADRTKHRESNAEIMKVLILTIIPVVLSTAIYNISGIIDQGVYKALSLDMGVTSSAVNTSWGIFSGKFKTLTNVPIAIANALVSSTIPGLTMCMVERHYKEARRKIQTSIRFTMVLTIPCAVGMGVLAGPILKLLYNDPDPDAVAMAVRMFQVGVVSIVLYAMSTLSNGILQGINQMRLPVIHSAVALVLHLGVLYVMLTKFHMGIYGVIQANNLFALLMCLMNGIAIRRHIGYRQELMRTFIIPGICSGFMGLAVFGLYKLLALFAGNAISTVLSIGVGACIYGALLLMLRGITKKELLEFPKGKTLYRIARKFHLM